MGKSVGRPPAVLVLASLTFFFNDTATTEIYTLSLHDALPIGACVAFGPAGDLFGPGSHGTTFGGNPVSCAAGLAVIRTIAGEGLLDHVKRVGELIRRGVEALGSPAI